MPGACRQFGRRSVVYLITALALAVADETNALGQASSAGRGGNRVAVAVTDVARAVWRPFLASHLADPFTGRPGHAAGAGTPTAARAGHDAARLGRGVQRLVRWRGCRSTDPAGGPR